MDVVDEEAGSPEGGGDLLLDLLVVAGSDDRFAPGRWRIIEEFGKRGSLEGGRGVGDYEFELCAES